MLFILIPIVWLSVAALVLAVCKMAARADALAPRYTPLIDTDLPSRVTALGARTRVERSAAGS
jgi:hypothetical protein